MKLKRTHRCGDCTKNLSNEIVTLSGWVDSKRNLGSLTFIVLRDRYGKTQTYFDMEKNTTLTEIANSLHLEDVISITGKVIERPEKMINTEMKTGEIEIIATELEILNRSEVTPFEIHDKINVSEENRLKYRYLDLRRSKMQKNMVLRHRVAKVTRDYFDSENFIEVETPILMKSTPEGARDFLVPSRMHHGHFYALPQSPQIYKQILMVAGIDRYFQIVKCFRDEDLRKDRQPEFTQIDVEMSFMDQNEIMAMAEGLIVNIFKKIMNMDIPTKFKRMTYDEALTRYGSDKPDTRFPMEIQDVKTCFEESTFKVFQNAFKNNLDIVAINCPSCADYSRKKIDKLVEKIKQYGAKGLVHFKFINGQFESSVNKFLTSNELQNLKTKLNPTENDLILLSVDNFYISHISLGALRSHIAEDKKLIEQNTWDLLWVTDFPMFEYQEESQNYVSMHHPFTSPNIKSAEELNQGLDKIKANAYDLVLNGNEIAGGSIRIHDREIQEKVFDLLQMTQEEQEEKFGFLLNSFKYGAPPHGGFAFGFDRLLMILSEADSIRDVIAFPKTQRGQSLMDNAPAIVSGKQLAELNLKSS